MINLITKFNYSIAKAVRFTFDELQDCTSNLHQKIEAAYGPQGLGLAVVSGIPNYLKFRQSLLPLAQRLASLPEQQLKELERPEHFHSKGWSCGVEQFKGKLDLTKGSFYNNPNYDQFPELTPEERQLLGSGVNLRIPNVWPPQIPEMEGAFKNLGRLMVDTGALLSYHIDKYIYSQNSNYEMGKLYRFARTSDQHTGRLLHYFAGKDEDEWCGWHNDHSALTALTCPIYMKGDQLIEFKNTQGGLLAKNRFTDVVKVQMDPTCLAFQIGETAQIVSGGIVEATPHAVVRGEEEIREGLNRNTFAVFMGPKFNERLNVPKGMDAQKALNKQGYNVPSLIGRWKEDILFQDYSANSYKAYSKY